MVPRDRALALTLVLLVLVCASRVAVYPASIWEQDEAYFAAAVVEIDLARSAPHPPFFPLWIGLGKVAHGLGLEPTAGLRVASACLGSLMVLPLLALWSRFLAVPLAVGAVALALFAPGVWLLSGRAFSGTAATALLAAALACWTRPEPGRRWTSAGSLAAGLAVLIRPHLALVVMAAALAQLAGPARRCRLALVAPALATVAVGFAAFGAAAGPPRTVWAAVSRHASAHFGSLSEAPRSLLASGVVPALGHGAITVAWLALTVVGVWLALRSREQRDAARPVAAALAAAALLAFGLSNPAHPRYAVPLVVLSSGFVVLGLRHLLPERWTTAAVAAAVAAAAGVVLPAAAVYRTEPSPPVRALAYAERAAERRAGVQVVDRTLHAFVVLRQATGEAVAPVVFDHVLELGATPPPPPARAVAVFDAGHDRLLEDAESRRVFSCGNRVLRGLAQDRFLDVTVVEGARLADRSGLGGPFVVLD